MTGFLTDTNVVSEFAKPAPDAHTTAWLRKTDPGTLFASVITLGELRRGVEKLAPSRRRAELEAWLQSGLPEWFDANLVSVTREVADQWGRLTIHAQRTGLTLSVTDGLIAATALAHELTLVTRNVKDFEGLGLKILNPWKP